MAAAKITAQGQITIPAEIRRHLAVEPGDRIEIFILDDGEVVMKRADKNVKELFGSLKKRASGKVSLSTMDQAIVHEVSQRVKVKK